MLLLSPDVGTSRQQPGQAAVSAVTPEGEGLKSANKFVFFSLMVMVMVSTWGEAATPRVSCAGGRHTPGPGGPGSPGHQ